METQPTQQGLMQLFMSLGLSTANPLTSLGEGETPEGSGFDSLLAGYLPDSDGPEAQISIATDASSLLEGELTNRDMGLNTIAQIETATLDEVEGLPLLSEEIGEPLPLSGLSAVNLDPAEVIPIASDKSNSETDDKANALLANQGFYAQSLVNSTLQTNAASANSLNQTGPSGQARISAMAEQNSAAHALASMQARGASNKAITDGAGQNVMSYADDLTMDDEATFDRFLGATHKDSNLRSSKLSSLVSPESMPTMSLTASGQVPVQLAAAAESNVSLALSMGEDPIQQSLQDLTAIEDAEKVEIETKIQTAERKQDDQTLKLTKGQQAWGDVLSERISLNAAQNIKQVTIHLDPPELGTLELKLQVKDDQQTQVQVQVQNPQVKEALESSAHRLRDMLASEGLELSEFDVHTGSEQGAGSEANDSQQGLDQDQQNSDTLIVEGDETLDINLPKNNNLLDTFV